MAGYCVTRTIFKMSHKKDVWRELIFKSLLPHCCLDSLEDKEYHSFSLHASLPGLFSENIDLSPWFVKQQIQQRFNLLTWIS